MLIGNLFAWLVIIPFIVAFAVGFMSYGFKNPDSETEK